MSTNTAELVRIVTDALTNDSTIDGYVDGRVRNTHSTDFDAGSMDFPAVVLHLTTGDGNYSKAVQTVVAEVWCWSQQNQGIATVLYDACYDVLQAERLTNADLDRVVVCRESDRPLQGYNDVFRAWYSMGRWIFTSSG